MRLDDTGRRKTDRAGAVVAPKVRIIALAPDASLDKLDEALTEAGFRVQVTRPSPAPTAQNWQSEGSVALLAVALPGTPASRALEQSLPAPGVYTVLIVEANTSDERLRALEHGVDDVVPGDTSSNEIVARLRSGARRLELERRLRLENEELTALALTDELTGVANRRALMRFANEVLHARRLVSVALFDLNGFKHINDTYGHAAGDRMLADIASTFKRYTRYGDLIGRFGGDEFVLILPDCEVTDARTAAERLQQRVEQLEWSFHDRRVTMHVAFGVASGSDPMTFPTLLAECDRRMYAAKSATSGRRVAAPRENRAAQ